MSSCGHPLCALIGGEACSIAVTRSRGCRPNVIEREVDFDGIRAAIAGAEWVRLAQLIRREMMDGRNVVALARAEELEFTDELVRLTRRNDPV
ncbi:MAG: hypothetical protein QM831_21070 [Kofleriaceae bacterium]